MALVRGLLIDCILRDVTITEIDIEDNIQLREKIGYITKFIIQDCFINSVHCNIIHSEDSFTDQNRIITAQSNDGSFQLFNKLFINTCNNNNLVSLSSTEINKIKNNITSYEFNDVMQPIVIID